MSVMISHRKISRSLKDITNFSSLLVTVKTMFPRINPASIRLTYIVGKNPNQIQLTNDESLNMLLAQRGKEQIRIFVCKDQAKIQKKSQLVSSKLITSISESKKIDDDQKTQKSSMGQIFSSLSVKENGNIGYAMIDRSQKSPQLLQNKHIHTGVSCQVCGISQIIGIRWKCQICLKYNLCNGCYKSQQKNKKHDASHNYHKIQNDHFFQAINYNQLISLFFDPHNEKKKGNKLWIRQDQFFNKDKKFLESIVSEQRQFIKFIDENIQVWEKNFLQQQKQHQ